MKRLTTDEPRGNLENALNLFYAKDNQAFVRGYGDGKPAKDLSLFDLTRRVADTLGIQLDSSSDEDLSYELNDMLAYSVDDPEGVLALLYTAGWVCAELRARLKQYEDVEEVLTHGKAVTR